MLTYLAVLVLFVFFSGIAMTVGEGLWSNIVSLMAIILSGVLALILGPPLGVLGLEKSGKEPEFMWYFTFAGIWLVFFISVLVIRLVAERLSKVRMKIVPPLEMVAGPLAGLLVATMFTSFVAFTIYTIPVKAGAWNYDKSADWQKTTIKSGAGPFNHVLKSIAGSEVADAYFSK